VLNYEPSRALFVPDTDPLMFYRKIAGFGRDHLNRGGLLFFEINEAFGKETVELLREMGYEDVELRKDINERERMVKARGNFKF
ncbi:MAG: protein-(glutamine-N5) methyltransferase, release factor-specific, partial [Butyricimonas faecihominis]